LSELLLAVAAKQPSTATTIAMSTSSTTQDKTSWRPDSWREKEIAQVRTCLRGTSSSFESLSFCSRMGLVSLPSKQKGLADVMASLPPFCHPGRHLPLARESRDVRLLFNQPPGALPSFRLFSMLSPCSLAILQRPPKTAPSSSHRHSDGDRPTPSSPRQGQQGRGVLASRRRLCRDLRWLLDGGSLSFVMVMTISNMGQSYSHGKRSVWRGVLQDPIQHKLSLVLLMSLIVICKSDVQLCSLARLDPMLDETG
jgi:hypothetical protein